MAPIWNLTDAVVDDFMIIKYKMYNALMNIGS